METADYPAIDVTQYWKIIVAGLPDSGRRTFIDAINELERVHGELSEAGVKRLIEARQAEKLGRTSYLGRKTLDEDLILYLLSTPDSQDFDLMLPLLKMENLPGFVMLVDSSNPATFTEAKRLAKILQVYNPLPYVIAANKQDLPNALSADTVKYALALPDDIPVIPCVAKKKESVKRVLLALLDKVLEGIGGEADSGE